MSGHPPDKKPAADALSPKVQEKILTVLVSRQMQGVAQDWAGLLGAPVAFDAPKLNALAEGHLPDLPWPVALTQVEVEGDLQGTFHVLTPALDAAAMCAGLLGRTPPSEGAKVEFDPEILDAMGELFNLFCGGTDRTFRKGADQKIHVKQVATKSAANADALKTEGLPQAGWIAAVTMSVGDRKGIRVWEVLPDTLGKALAQSHHDELKDATATGGQVAQVKTTKGRVLVVDDQYTIRTLIKRHLQSDGFEVVEAEGGQEALRKLKNEKEKGRLLAVISDVMMPHMDGFELCRQIRHMEEWKALPIVMCTGKGQGKDVGEALQAGANDYIVKPFTREILLQKLEKALKKTKA